MSDSTLPGSLARFDLTSRTALVTGSTRGLGQTMAVALASAGARIVVHANRTDPAMTLEAIAQVAPSSIPAPFVVHGDLAERPSLDALVDQVVKAVGVPDVLVNNAGITERHPPGEFPTASWDRIVEVNINATFRLCQRFGKGMLERGRGKIINMASLLSFTGGTRVPAYAATKHAVAGLTKALASDWAPHGLHVNAIAPGWLATDLNADLRHDPAIGPKLLERIPMGRFGRPDDLDGAIVFLASDASDFVNGALLVVDGGWSAR